MTNGAPLRRTKSGTGTTLNGRKKSLENAASLPARKSLSSRSMRMTGERTVKRLRLSKALTLPETTSVYEACRRMAACRVDAVLLTDAKDLLCGILTDKDIAKRAIACEVNLKETPVSKVMTRNPVFVLSDTHAVEALEKMVHGKFRHLPVVENGEVLALLDIAKCLYDAIARLERADEKGKAIAAAVEGVDKHWGASLSGSNILLELLPQKIFKPSLSTIIPENSKILTVAPEDTVLAAAKKMHEYRRSSAIVTVENRPQGILTSRDILMRVVAEDLPAEFTAVEKVMTANPECVTVDSPIISALQTMQQGKFLHLPVLNKDGVVVAVVDVLHITNAAVATVGSTAGVDDETADKMLQKFWDSAMISTPEEEVHMPSETSLKMASEEADIGKSVSLSRSGLLDTCVFKIQDKKGRLHRFICETGSLKDLMTAILHRIGSDIDQDNPPEILYEDEDHDKVVLESDEDFILAIEHARQAGWKGLRLHLDYSGSPPCHLRDSMPGKGIHYLQAEAWTTTAYSAAAIGTALTTVLGILAFLKRSV